MPHSRTLPSGVGQPAERGQQVSWMVWPALAARTCGRRSPRSPAHALPPQGPGRDRSASHGTSAGLPPLGVAGVDGSDRLVDPPRLSRRLHPLRGSGHKSVRENYAPRRESGRFICFWNTRTSMTLNGRRLVRWQPRSDARPRRCGAGFDRLSAMEANGPTSRPTRPNGSTSSSARYASWGRRPRSCARRALISFAQAEHDRRFSHDGVHRRTPRRVRNRADLPAVGDRSVDLRRPPRQACRPDLRSNQSLWDAAL